MTLAVTWHILGQTEVIFTTCRIADREEQVTCLKRADLSLCYRNHKINLSVHRIWIYMWRLKVVCSKHTQVFCLHAIHLKQLFSWNTLVQFWFPTDNQGRSHMTISLRYKRAYFQPLNQQNNYDLCVLVTLWWSTVPYSSRKVHDNETSYTNRFENHSNTTSHLQSHNYTLPNLMKTHAYHNWPQNNKNKTRIMKSQPIIIAK